MDNPFPTALAAAIAHLIGRGVVKSTAQVARELGYKSRGTVSDYANGNVPYGDDFSTLFENKYGIKLSDFNAHPATTENSGKNSRFLRKLRAIKEEDVVEKRGIPVYDVPIDASFLERYRDEHIEPIFYINIPRLRNCDFGAVVSGSSMYPLMKSGSFAFCRVVTDLQYFDPGEMYFLATTNGFETVKYVQPGEDPDELVLIPHNDKIRPTTIRKEMVLKMCIVEAWINFR